MSDDLPNALRFILRWEGGLSDDPNDHGGRTMKGITQHVYDAWRVARGLGTQDVVGIADDELAAIYRENYWTKSFCDRQRAKLDLVQFDTAMNMGPNRAVRMLQEAVGTDVDGGFGPQTQQARDNCALPDSVARYCDIRERLYRGFAQQPGQANFLAGWMNRLNDLRIEAGVPGFTHKRGASGPDFGDVPGIRRIPDLAPDQPLERFS